MGNMMQENIFNIWKGKMMSKYRKKLIQGKRDCSPCNKCNAEGTMLGKDHAKAWKDYYRFNNFLNEIKTLIFKCINLIIISKIKKF